MMEGEILHEHFEYSLKKAHGGVNDMEQRRDESLKNYTQRAENLWRAIRRVELVSEEVLSSRFKAVSEEAIEIWATGITQPDLREFVRKGFLEDAWGKEDWKGLQKHYKRAREWLERAAKVPSLANQPQTGKAVKTGQAPNPGRSKQRPLVAVMAPSDQGESTNGRDRRNPRQRQGFQRSVASSQGQNSQSEPCQDCADGIFTWGKGCNNLSCKSKCMKCNYCGQISFQPRRGCLNASCPAKPSGNGRVAGA